METKITRMTLQGFKSFKKKVSIPFDNGFMVVCGPNGVGKSNILDAISFALGRSSAKSLRADRLHELIYHGNDRSAKPADYASVTLWFDNATKTFPFETEEVAITRKVNKQGMSLFKINGRTTTRDKILELLSTARVHPDGFNIIMQGDVTQVIEMSPEDRRGVIDEVAGISHYNEKKEKALFNLEKVSQKLKEVEIIISERMERLQSLETDRNAALRYKDLQKRLDVFRASLAHKRYSLLNSDLEKMNKEVTESEEEITRLEGEIKEIEADMDRMEKEKEKISERVFVRSRESGIREELEEFRNKLVRNETRIESNVREIERLNRMIERLESLGNKRGGFSSGVQAILNLARKGVHGVISNLIKVPKEYEVAAEVAAGMKLQNVIVDDTLLASECINYLKDQRIGRATFLPLNRMKGRFLTPEQKKLLKKPGVVGLLSELVRFDKKYSPAVEHIFGDTVVVENLGVAREIGIGNIRMVTLDGDLTEKSGAMIGGYYQKREMLNTDSEIKEYQYMKGELDEENNFLKIEIDQLNRKIEDLKLSQEKEVRNVVDLEEEKIGIDKKLDEERGNRRSKYEERIKLQDKINRMKIRAARVEAETENFKIEVEKYGDDVEYIDERQEILEVQISDAIREMNSLGMVNMKAIEEYDQFRIEFDELKAKYDKINEERLSIEEMIMRIEEKKREVFFETLGGVSKNFQNIFREMGAGEASLELEDVMDIESGLLIKANATGKNQLNLDAMSGGEKSVTALAFLFAIQLYKPAPFYILDEIDAFLDKVNTKRIVEMIKKLSRNEQFIVITHNDHTIKQGDKIYGVTMENGESKILGLELPREVGLSG